MIYECTKIMTDFSHLPLQFEHSNLPNIEWIVISLGSWWLFTSRRLLKAFRSANSGPCFSNASNHDFLLIMEDIFSDWMKYESQTSGLCSESWLGFRDLRRYFTVYQCCQKSFGDFRHFRIKNSPKSPTSEPNFALFCDWIEIRNSNKWYVVGLSTMWLSFLVYLNIQSVLLYSCHLSPGKHFGKLGLLYRSQVHQVIHWSFQAWHFCCGCSRLL